MKSFEELFKSCPWLSKDLDINNNNVIIGTWYYCSAPSRQRQVYPKCTEENCAIYYFMKEAGKC